MTMNTHASPLRLLAWIAPALVACTLAVLPSTARAVPSFSRETGMECSFCHTVFPELTAEGRKFKMLGYTAGHTTGASVTKVKTDDNDDLPVMATAPLGAFIQVSDNFIGRQPVSGTATPGSDQKGTVELPTQFSLFYAGPIAPKAGAFVQLTYDNGSGVMHLDSGTDIRYADELKVGGKDMIYGITANTGPAMSDVWNSTPVWSFPYATSSLDPGAVAAAQIDNAQLGSVAGLGAYTFWNDFVYAEIAAYRSAPQGLDQGGTYEDIQGFAPYWRVALQHTWEDGSSAELGAYGLQIQDYPSTALPQGPVDQYTDAAVDAQVQWIGDDNLVTAHSTFIHEDQALGTTFANAGSANLYNRINTFRADATYFYRRTLGLTAGYFATDGTTDAVQYPGSANGSPMTNGLVYEFNYVPAQNTKLMLQYRTYLNYAGASGNYDGLGRNAFDNDTLMLMAWLGY